ncbi:hypothetical protein [Desulfospira joergensenii]|uniref:hypothetical protein n=1 Tax=Desulfospira joergensenii TaxID=53329 RepID=UPI0003B66EA2|nr:hypothetical protein [Desulfospira joergensenii]
MTANIPRVSGQTFVDAVKDVLDTLTGKKRKAKYDRALTVRDLERLKINGTPIDLDRFLKSDKQNPYSI